MGGILVSFVPALIIDGFYKVPVYETALKCVIILPAAFAGDYFASLLKRRAGIKDFSGLIPGHGGILDRFDSHFLAGAVYFCFLLITEHF